MNGVLLVLIILVVAAIGLAVWSASRNSSNRSAASLADAKADARRVIERLGGQVLNLTGTDDASKQALADASERYTAAGSQIEQATTAKQALLAKESALEGLYYVRAARTAMGMDPGPELESLVGQQVGGHRHRGSAGQLRRPRNRGLAEPVGAHPELLPRRPRRGSSGSRRLVLRAVVEACAGRRAPGASVRCCSLTRMFSGMHGVDYGAQGFESGYGDGYSDGLRRRAGRRRGRRRRRRWLRRWWRRRRRLGGTAAAGDGGGWGGGDFGGGDFGGDFGGF